MSTFFEFIRGVVLSKDMRRRTINLFAFLFNLCYIFFNLASGIVYENILSVTVSAYYMVTVFVRYFILGDSVSITPYLLLILAFPITGIIIYTVLTGDAKKYPVWILAMLAVYSAATVIRSISGIASAGRAGDGERRTMYSARLSAALMSLFNFQNSYISAISSDKGFARGVNLILGGIISASVFYLAVSSLKNRSQI